MTALTVDNSAGGRNAVAKTITKTVVGLALFAATAAGLYVGAGAFTRHYTAPDTTVSYADQSTVQSRLDGAWHTPATKGGAFRDDASIDTPDVVSVVQVVTGP